MPSLFSIVLNWPEQAMNPMFRDLLYEECRLMVFSLVYIEDCDLKPWLIPKYETLPRGIMGLIPKSHLCRVKACLFSSSVCKYLFSP